MNKTELQKMYPQAFSMKLHKYLDIIEVDVNGEKVKVVLDYLNWESNRSPFSTLWARRVAPVWIGNDGEKDIYEDGPCEALGIVYVTNGKFVPINDMDKLSFNIGNVNELVRLYWELMALAFPYKPGFFARVKNKFLAFFSKKK